MAGGRHFQMCILPYRTVNNVIDLYERGWFGAAGGRGADASGSFTATVAAPQSVNGMRLFLGVGHHSGKMGAANYRVNALLTLDPTSGR
jgi:hypothetical protein